MMLRSVGYEVFILVSRLSDTSLAFEYLSAVAWKGGRTDVMFDLDAQVLLHPSETDRLRRSFCAKGKQQLSVLFAL
jgi:hypothetical protein